MGVEIKAGEEVAVVLAPAQGMRRLLEVVDLATEALFIDGGHHKQWYLEQILKTALGDSFDDHIAALAAEGYEYEPGLPP